jgi:hypothetical protein
VQDERKLRTRERNAVHAAIERLGLDPVEFTWSDRLSAGSIVESIEHAPTDSYFTLGVSDDGTYYFGEFEPGNVAQVQRFGGLNWPDAEANLRAWLGNIQTEFAEADRWAEVDHAREELSAVFDGDADFDVPLSPDDQQRIVEHLGWIRETITTAQDMTPGQLALIDTRLGELEAASHRLTRKDFALLAIGGVVTLVISVGVLPEVRSELLRATIIVVSAITRGVAELPPPVTS